MMVDKLHAACILQGRKRSKQNTQGHYIACDAGKNFFSNPSNSEHSFLIMLLGAWKLRSAFGMVTAQNAQVNVLQWLLMLC